MSPRKARIPPLPSGFEVVLAKALREIFSDHALEAADLTEATCRRMGVEDRAALDTARRGALAHDIGKVYVGDEILLKPGPLTPSEQKRMRKHPCYGYRVCRLVSSLRKAWRVPLYHHEWWNGGGYPHGLKGARIPIEARAFAVIDVYSALSEPRPYRPALPQAEVWRLLEEGRGTQFDPKALDAFRQVWDKGRR